MDFSTSCLNGVQSSIAPETGPRGGAGHAVKFCVGVTVLSCHTHSLRILALRLASLFSLRTSFAAVHATRGVRRKVDETDEGGAFPFPR